MRRDEGRPYPALAASCRTGRPDSAEHNAVIALTRTVGDMQVNRRQVPTGTYRGGNHPEQIEYRYALVNGEEIPDGQSGPRCFRVGCPDNEAAIAREQRRGRPRP